jgi:hypothetical protein
MQPDFPFRRVFLLLLAFFSSVGLAVGQKKPAAPVPNPKAPTLAPVVPLGIQRGTTLELTLTGTNLAAPVALWTSFPAKVTIPTDKNNGKDNTKLRVKLEVPADAPLGFQSLRLATERGLSNFRPFCIDDLPQLLELNTNHERDKAQSVPVPCVVVGRADAELSDYFRVSVKPQERLTFEVLGRRLGSAFDPQLRLFDAKTGRDLPGGQSNDAPGLQSDARLTCTFKDGGDIIVEIRDTTYRGGADYHYRLRIGDFPAAVTPYPLAVKRGSKTKVSFVGRDIEGVVPTEVVAPTDPAIPCVWLAPHRAQGPHGWPVALFLSDLDEVVEPESKETGKPMRVLVPCGISGRFPKKGDRDSYVFAAKKGQRLAIEAQTLEMFSPTEVYMVVKDAKGGQVAASNPAAAPRIDFAPAADGDYTLTVEHLHYWGGPEEVYHLTITPAQSDFDLSVKLDRFDAPAGGTFSTPVFITRKNYKGPIEVSVSGHPALSGKLAVPANVPAKPNTPAGTLTVTVKAGTALGPILFKVQGTATVEGKPLVRFAETRATLGPVLGNLPYPPPQFETQLGVAVTPKGAAKPAPKPKPKKKS